MKTLTEIAELFRQRLQALGRTPATVTATVERLRLLLRWLATVQGVTTAARLHRGHLQGYQRHLATRCTPAGLPLKPKTINNLIQAAKGFLLYLARQGYLTGNLVEALQYVREPKLLPASVLEHAEMRKLLRRISTTTPIGFRNRTIAELLYSTGIRRAGLLALHIADVDIANATLRVMGKGRKERMVPIGRTALRYLTGYLRAIRPAWTAAHSTTALFLNQYGKPLKWGGLKKIIGKYFAAASVVVTPHTFRRSCTTELIRGNANLYHVKELLGHKDLASLRPYTRLTILDLKKTHAKCHPRERDERGERG